MNTYLIISENTEFIKKSIGKLLGKIKSESVNNYTLDPENSIGIEDIRKIRQFCILKPYGGGNRAIILFKFHKATLEAQNAILKILEEPPSNTYFILISNTADTLLPTIQSRCQIIHEITGKTAKTGNVNPDYEKAGKIAIEIFKAGTGDRINISIKNTKNKEDALRFFYNLTQYLQSQLHSSNREISIPDIDIARTIDKIEKAKGLIEGNINYKAITDLLILSFPKI